MWKMTQLLLRPSSPRVRFSTPPLSTRPFSSIRPWKQASVESRGHYPDEAWIEEHVGGPLYQHQKSLPRLPVLSIEDTLRRFLPTALPLAKSSQEAQALQSAVAKFPQQAAQLQERLLQRQKDNPNSSWLQHWWNTAGYLQVRDSVVINVSYFFHFQKDPTAVSQIQRGAALLVAAADFRKKVVTGQLPAEAVGKHKTPLCSVAYKYMFHACRIPVRDHDSYMIYDPARNRHAAVACRGHFFKMDFVDEDGNAYPLSVLEEGLQKCRDLADELPPSLPLGWLTSQNRDDWADARQTLLESCPRMEQALEVLQSAALLICLDEVDRASSEGMAQLLLHAGRDASSGANRWFDKSIQLVLTKEGQAGLVGEHSMMDGMPVMNFANRLTEVTYAQAGALATAKVTSCNVGPIFSNLNISSAHKSQIDRHINKGKISRL
jgi:carnitine O-acetyltransferase